MMPIVKENRLVSTYMLLPITVFISLWVFSTNCELYTTLAQEDSLVENVTALLLGVSGIFLFRAGIIKDGLSRALLIVVAVVFVVAALEEISWGQRIFGWVTPESLAAINDQNETNFHNINKKFFDRMLDRSIILFVIVTTFLRSRGTVEIWKIALPTLSIICMFAVVPFYNDDLQHGLDFYHILYLPITYLLISKLKKKDKLVLVIIFVTFIMMLALPWIIDYLASQCPAGDNSTNEWRELLFSIGVVAYSTQLATIKDHHTA